MARSKQSKRKKAEAAQEHSSSPGLSQPPPAKRAKTASPSNPNAITSKKKKARTPPRVGLLPTPPSASGKEDLAAMQVANEVFTWRGRDGGNNGFTWKVCKTSVDCEELAKCIRSCMSRYTFDNVPTSKAKKLFQLLNDAASAMLGVLFEWQGTVVGGTMINLQLGKGLRERTLRANAGGAARDERILVVPVFYIMRTPQLPRPVEAAALLLLFTLSLALDCTAMELRQRIPGVNKARKLEEDTWVALGATITRLCTEKGLKKQCSIISFDGPFMAEVLMNVDDAWKNGKKRKR